MKNLGKVISIVTLYNPKEKHIKNIRNIAKQSDRVIVCDNSIADNNKKFLRNDKCIYLHWGENYGLSKAFNIALSNDTFNWADEDVIVFFDQDSVLPDNHIQELLKEYEFLTNCGADVGAIGPVYFDSSTGKEEIPRFFQNVTPSVMEVDSIVTTSMMCQYKVIKKVGFWNSNIFLDMADWDICWRLAANGYKIYLTKSSILHHSVGEGVRKLGPFRLRIGKTFREYYETRDCIKLIFKRYVPLKYKIRFIAMLTIRPILRLILLDDRFKRIRYFFIGVIDGVRNRNGMIEE